MNIRNSFLVFLCIFCVAQPCALLAVQKSLPASSFERLNYSFAGKEFEEPYWGMTKGDLNGDGVKQWVLLARNSIVVGDFENEKFVSAAQCSWKGDAQGGRVYAYDIDGDGDDEIIISAVSFAKPASVILNFKNGRCEELMTNIPYSLRVVKGKEGFIGQSWSSSDYFFGKIFKLGVEKNKLKRAGSMVLPWLTYLYDFDIFETADEGLYCILQKGIDYLELRKKTGRKFKRMWRSPDKFGGSINQIFAPSRAVLGSDTGEFVTFPTAPVYLATGENLRVIAKKYGQGEQKDYHHKKHVCEAIKISVIEKNHHEHENRSDDGPNKL